MRFRLIALLCLVAVLLASAIWWARKNQVQEAAPDAKTSIAQPHAAVSPVKSTANSTAISAHNLRLHQGPNFRVYVRWLRGNMVPTKRNVSPSFDDLESFYLGITNGVLRANLGDISNYLNSANSDSPLKNVVVTGNGSDVKIKGTLHKVVPLPIELIGKLSTASNNRVQMHIVKINVLKIPFKALLGDFHVKLADLFHSKINGVEVSDNDIYFDSQALLPPPHIRGSLSNVTIDNPDLQATYGDAGQDIAKTEQWRNFLRLRNGSINFGKLTMDPVDLIMVDISQDAWFDLDLSRYQEQLVNGYTRMTPQAGLQIFMPDLATLSANKANQNISIEWLKNRNLAPPKDVLAKK